MTDVDCQGASRGSVTNNVNSLQEAQEAQVDDDFTLRGLLAGLLIGCLLAFTNLYLGLQSGWISIMSLQSSLLGYALFKLIPRSVTIRCRRYVLLAKPFTPAENVLVQTTAAAVGIMPLSAGLVGVIPALTKLSLDQDGAKPVQLDFIHLVAWCLAIAYFGVFFASPLREPMIVREKLTFPSGTATAQLISVLHGKPLRAEEKHIQQQAEADSDRDYTENTDVEVDEQTRLLSSGDEPIDKEVAQATRQGWKSLSYSFVGSSAFTVLSYYVPVLYAVPIFDILPPHNLSSMWGFWFTPSLNYIGQGIIMGLPTTVSMTAGALVGWGILGPMAHYYGWAPGHPLDSETGGRGWIIWVSLAVMCSESIIGLVTLVATNGVRDLKAYSAASREHVHPGRLDGHRDSDMDHEPVHRQTPTTWIISGLLISTLLAVVLVYWVFGVEGISPWATVVGIVLASVFAILGVRALGETDLNPVSGIGKISQLVFALLQPGNVVANLIAGGISEAGAMQAGDLMQDYKTGHLVGASPRAQFKGQLIGSTLGILVSSFAYKLYTTAYVIPGPQFPAPTAAVWLNLARLVNRGHLPAHVQTFMIVFGSVFAVSGAVKTLARSRALRQESRSSPSRADQIARYVPSGIAFAVGILNTPNFSFARLLGGLIAHFYAARQRKQQQGNDGHSNRQTALTGIGIIIIASGFVLGEGAASIITLLLKQHGAQIWTCAGCRGGCAASCAT